jgi:group II intron reverse transcriptase/maturase
VYRKDVLAKAWQEVKANAGAAGIDERTIEDIEQSGVEGFLDALATDLREGRYRPRAVRRVWIPKPDGRQRPLGVPTIRDRVCQAAAKGVLEPIFEAEFRPSSFGFRPKRSAHQAGEQIRKAVNRGQDWIVDADIEAFYDRIEQALLMQLVEKRICDRRMLKLLRQWLNAGVVDGGDWVPTDQGVAQGSPISPLLANVVLHELDRLWEDRCSHLGQLIRYADDLVVLCRTRSDAEEALRRIGLILGRLKLTLHPDKTRVVCIRDGREGFDFLGFHCRKVESWRKRGRLFLQRWPSRRAMQRVRDRIKAITAPRHRLPEPVSGIVNELNQLLRGWGAYFRVGNSTRKFQQVDDYVRERLALFVSKKAGRRGPHRERYNRTYFKRLGVYELVGTVAWYTATPIATR